MPMNRKRTEKSGGDYCELNRENEESKVKRREM